MNDEALKLLIQMADALDGARTWIDNMGTGSHVLKLPAVDVIEYMPNNITGRVRMYELAQKARILAGLTQVPTECRGPRDPVDGSCSCYTSN